jgi:hypothetical protein
MLRILKRIVRRLATLNYAILEVLGLPRMPDEPRPEPEEPSR